MSSSNQTSRRRPFLVLFIFLFFFATVGWLGFAPLSKSTTHLYLHPSTAYEELQATLDTCAHPLQLTAFQMLMQWTGSEQHVHPGRYRLKGIGAFKLWYDLRRGRQEPLQLNVPLVWTPNHLAQKLGRRLAADSAALARIFSDTALCGELGVTPETLFTIIIPNTYEFYWTVTPADFLRRMKLESDRYWTEARLAQAKEQGLTRTEAVTLASIVEKETTNVEEKPRIAGLYLNRIRQGMRLQADPTVKFALGDFRLRRILTRHLRTPSPYNTYLVYGLPPAPICLPSRESIESVLNAEQHNYLYMCAREDFSGRHNFAATYGEHQQNARRYAAALNARGIR